MSRENVEVVRRIYDAGKRREGAAVLPLYDEQVVWEGGPGEALLGREVWHGHDGIREAFRQWYDAWEHVEHDVDEFIEADPHVIAVGTMRGRGRASGVEVVWNGYASVWTLRDRKVVRVAWFPSRDEALEAIRVRD